MEAMLRQLAELLASQVPGNVRALICVAGEESGTIYSFTVVNLPPETQHVMLQLAEEDLTTPTEVYELKTVRH